MTNAIKSIEVLGTDVKIVELEKVLLGENIFGQYRPVSGEIAIYPGLCAHQQGHTCMHEIVEALAWQLDSTLPHDQLSALASGLHAVLRANPGLVKAICEGKKIIDG